MVTKHPSAHSVHTLFVGQVLEAGAVELSTDTGILAKIEDGNFAVYRGDDKLWQTDTFGVCGPLSCSIHLG